MASQKWQAKNGAQNDTSKKTIQEKRERAQYLEAFLDKNACKVSWFIWSNKDLKWSLDRCQTVFDTFRDYGRAQPGQEGSKADWGGYVAQLVPT
ncbi:hypothetical protein [Tardiphaga sp. 768_D3_N2_1]|uniref:hypothetical protein n=1 Tax=Tardiphaga sp. 768_D3_N2_1 TaxID=3240783 RepID=UPI003F8AE0E6